MPRLMLSERMLTLLGPQLRERHPALELVSIEFGMGSRFNLSATQLLNA